MDIHVTRIRPSLSGNALSWSQDGDLVICASLNPVVYSPLDYEPGEKLKWLRKDLPEPESYPWADPKTEIEKDRPAYASDSGISSIDMNSSYPISAKWSPTGMSPNSSCFLTYLTSKHSLLMFYNLGEVGKHEWTLYGNIAVDLTSPITCFDWTTLDTEVGPTSEQDELFGTAFLAVGTEHGGIWIYELAEQKLIPVRQHSVDKVLDLKIVQNTVYALTRSAVHIFNQDSVPQVFDIEEGHVSCMHADEGGILIAQPNKVTSFPQSTVVTTGINDSIVGFLGTTQNWAVVSQKGNWYSNGFETGLQSYLNSKRADANLTVYGLATSADGCSTVLCISTRPKDHLYYPTVRNRTATLSFRNLTPPQATFTKYSFSPRALWASAYLYNQKQPGYLEGAGVGQCETLLKFIKSCKSASLCTYFSIHDFTLEMQTSIADYLFTKYAASELSDIDRAILASYSHFNKKSISCPSSINISSGLLSETFDFNDQKQHTRDITSVSGHKWKRCAITLLPIFSMDTMASTDNTYAILTATATEVLGSRIAAELVSLPLCVFNGCRFYTRVFPVR